MAMPKFLRDPDQAAELAALLRDTADDHTDQLQNIRGTLSRSDVTRHEQTITRYRRWADELDAPAEAPEARPVHIRPAREQHTEATG